MAGRPVYLLIFYAYSETWTTDSVQLQCNEADSGIFENFLSNITTLSFACNKFVIKKLNYNKNESVQVLFLYYHSQCFCNCKFQQLHLCYRSVSDTYS